MTTEIREAAESDAEAMAELLVQLVREPTTAPEVVGRLRRLAASAHVRNIVACDGDVVVGLASVHIEPVLHHERPVARLMSIVVDDGRRGQGIGRRLMDAALEISRAGGCDRIELTSRLEREGAHSFYEAVGFSYVSKKFQKVL